MKVFKTSIDGALLLKPKIFNDDRGFFLESWNKKPSKLKAKSRQKMGQNH